MFLKSRFLAQNPRKSPASTGLLEAVLLLVLFLHLGTSPLPSKANDSVDPQIKTGEAVKEAYGAAKIPQPDMATWYSGKSAEWLTDELRIQFFPKSTRAAGLEGEPPASEIFDDQTSLGFMFLTVDAVPSLGFSSLPFKIAVGLGLDGNITAATLLEHNEPIIDILLLDGLNKFTTSIQGSISVAHGELALLRYHT